MWNQYRIIMESYSRKPDSSGRPVWGAAMTSALASLAPLFLAMAHEWPLRTDDGWRYIFIGVMMIASLALALLYDRLGERVPKTAPWVQYYNYLMTVIVMHVSVGGTFIVYMVFDGAPEQTDRAAWILSGVVVTMTASCFAVLLLNFFRQRHNAKGPANGEAPASRSQDAKN